MIRLRYESFEKDNFPKIDQGNHEMSVKIKLWVFAKVTSLVKTFSPINMYELNGFSSSHLEISLPVGSNTLAFQLLGTFIYS